jgi:hypothetical protein
MTSGGKETGIVREDRNFGMRFSTKQTHGSIVQAQTPILVMGVKSKHRTPEPEMAAPSSKSRADLSRRLPLLVKATNRRSFQLRESKIGIGSKRMLEQRRL